MCDGLVTMVVFKAEKFDISDFTAFIIDFRKESDRAAVVLGAAKLDSLLEKLLESYLLPFNSKKDRNIIFSFNGPLGTFSSRIHMVYRLRILDEDYFKILILIKKIRNEFAHNISSLKLDKPPISDLVMEITNPLMKFETLQSFRDDLFKGVNDYSANFRTVLALLIFMLEYLSNNVTNFHSGEPFPLLFPFELTERLSK